MSLIWAKISFLPRNNDEPLPSVILKKSIQGQYHAHGLTITIINGSIQFTDDANQFPKTF